MDEAAETLLLPFWGLLSQLLLPFAGGTFIPTGVFPKRFPSLLLHVLRFRSQKKKKKDNTGSFGGFSFC